MAEFLARVKRAIQLVRLLNLPALGLSPEHRTGKPLSWAIECELRGSRMGKCEANPLLDWIHFAEINRMGGQFNGIPLGFG